MYLRGFDRRGAAASINNASASGFTVSGCWSDQADFAVLMLFDADDQFGHLFTSRYLPDFSLAGVTLDFDLALSGCTNPTSAKYQSVPWGALSYITSAEVQGTVALPAPTATTGAVAASASFTVGGTPVAWDRVQLVYLSNVIFEVIVGQTYNGVVVLTTAQIATELARQVNVNGNLTATASGAALTVSAPAGADGNGVELVTMYGSLYGAVVSTQIYPQGASGSPPPSGLTGKLTGGVDPTSLHYHLDFSVLGLGNCRQIWLTVAPPLNYDSGAVNPSLVAFSPMEFSAVFSNWTVADPGGVTPLKIAGPGSVTIGSRDAWASYAGSGWSGQVGWYLAGFARQSAHAGDTVTIKYSCQATHNLYLGTALTNVSGQFTATVDGVAVSPISCYANSGSAIYARRLVKSSVAAGSHTVVLTVASGAHGNVCLFDYLQAAVLSDVQSPAATYSHVNCACDFDTDQTYKIAPARALWILGQAGLAGDIDFYAGVFFALKRVRNGGNFRQAKITLSGTIGTGTGWGDGDIVWVTVGGSTANPPNAGTIISGATTLGGNPTGGSALGGTVLGAAAYPTDTLATLAQRLVDAINGLFVGICAAPTSTAGQFTITVLSPINGFSLDVSLNAGASVSLAVAGDIGTSGFVGGNEGVWTVDACQSQPLNRGFHDYLADFSGLVHAAGQTMTLAFSQELLAPPDSNDAAPASVTFGFFNYLGTGYAHYITIGGNTYTHIQLAGDGSGDIAIALAGLVNAGGGDPNARASVSANNVILAPRCTGQVACSASDGNGPGTLKSGAWSQRFADGSTVLTSTGFGSWGAGVVESVSSGVYQQTGHGYITGNTAHFASATQSGEWALVVVDANHYTLGAQIANSGGYTPAVGDSVLIDLQTSQCTFNPATVTAYLALCYVQAADILAAAGLVPWLQFGEVGWWFYSRVQNLAVGYASWTAPISVGTNQPHTLATGNRVITAGVQGDTAANGDQTITVTDSTHFTENGTSGNGSYVAGTGTVSGGGMAYYDAWAASAATAALGRALANFQHQDDDPTVNSGADAAWLASCIKTHIDAIRTAVLAVQSGAKFELLWPFDVNYSTVYWTNDMPWPQGGRLNRAVNLPAAYLAKAGSGLDRFKMEALSWGSTYRNLTNAKLAIAFPWTVGTWSRDNAAYLVPWSNGGCAWPAEFLAWLNAIIAALPDTPSPIVNFWAVDHLTLLGWRTQPLPSNPSAAIVF